MTIERRGSRWRAQVDVGTHPVTGKRDRLSETFATETEAIAWEHTTKAQYLGKGISSDHGMTCAELLDAHYDAKAPTAKTTRGRWSVAWAADARRIIDQQLIPALGDVQVRRLTSARLDDLYRAWEDDGRSAYQIRNANAVLRGALRRAVRSHVVEQNVAAQAELPGLPKTDRPLPTADDVRAIVQANPRLMLLAQLGVATGHRLGALCALRWSDLDLRAQTVTIARSIGRDLVVVDDPARRKLKRPVTISLDDETCDVLRTRHRAVRQLAMRAGTSLVPDAYLLSEADDGSVPANPITLSNAWSKAKAEAGRGHVRFHDLRHLHVSMLLRAGVDLVAVAYRVGHSSPRVTAQTYAHVMDELGQPDRRGADVMGTFTRRLSG